MQFKIEKIDRVSDLMVVEGAVLSGIIQSGDMLTDGKHNFKVKGFALGSGSSNKQTISLSVTAQTKPCGVNPGDVWTHL